MPALKLYRSKEHPDHWIGEDRHGALLIFPAKIRGWASRTPYVASKRDLEEVSPVLARGTKWPGAIGGRARDPSGKPSRPVALRATDDEREKWQGAAEERDLSLAEWARESLNETADRQARAKRPKGKP
jgi:hypothetical protein